MAGIGIVMRVNLLYALADAMISVSVFRVLQAAGAAASLPVLIDVMLGAFSMWLIALDRLDKVYIIGTLGTGTGGLQLTVWLRRPFIDRPKPDKV